uniref:Uncharacterized protein n=1 Tax=Meloidogyne enterolobii TaxID=390850 RepID=A0A6V7YBK4_MELEN|nr:unnamed protein product [Meloidogyne enterolobii]
MMKRCYKYADILFKILKSGNNFNGVWLRSNTLQKLFDIVLTHIETSQDCSKIVANIKLNNLEIPFTDLNERAEKLK